MILRFSKIDFSEVNPVVHTGCRTIPSFSIWSKLTLLLRLSTIACASSITFELHFLLFILYLYGNGHWRRFNGTRRLRIP